MRLVCVSVGSEHAANQIAVAELRVTVIDCVFIVVERASATRAMHIVVVLDPVSVPIGGQMMITAVRDDVPHTDIDVYDLNVVGARAAVLAFPLSDKRMCGGGLGGGAGGGGLGGGGLGLGGSRRRRRTGLGGGGLGGGRRRVRRGGGGGCGKGGGGGLGGGGLGGGCGRGGGLGSGGLGGGGLGGGGPGGGLGGGLGGGGEQTAYLDLRRLR